MWKTDTNMSLLDEIKGIKVPDLEVYIISVWQSKRNKSSFRL